ncbi:MAG: sensor histidine kinase [Meiothermus sp.]|uniref:sensor histidine kinase n=1 Tax=Meiothermus sp. TaxID=1955249 RepID=UPI00298F337C|nr:sensor histidine kinase [Meiothermus sp.]MDW8426915.1 sensor histidine kinase [Meiothermus sp.]
MAERHWVRYLWLVYLLPAFIPLLASPGVGLADWLPTLLGLGLFLPLYLRSYRLEGSSLWPYLGGLALLGLLFSQFNPYLSVFFVYAAAGAAYLGHPRQTWAALGGLLALVLLSGTLYGLRGWNPLGFAFVSALVFVPLVGALGLLEAERRRYQEQLLAAQEENRRLAALAERERIARDLHDLLGHTLTLISRKAELAARLARVDPERALGEMQEVERISREATRQVRQAVQGYQSPGWLGELAGARLALEAAGVALDYLAEPVALEPLQEEVLARALREAVTNVVRHSGARRCTVRLFESDGAVILEVRDDGRGGAFRPGTGLKGMQARLEALGGGLEASGEQGFSLRAWLPRAQVLQGAG